MSRNKRGIRVPAEAGKALVPGYDVGKSFYEKLRKLETQAEIRLDQKDTTMDSRGMSIKWSDVQQQIEHYLNRRDDP